MSKQVIKLGPAGTSKDTAAGICRLAYRGSEIHFSPGDYLLGRSPSVDLVIEDPLASRRHARLSVRVGSVTIEDLDSINGVYVNGERLGDAPRLLEDGDLLVIGSEELTVSLGGIDGGNGDSDEVTVQTLVPKGPVAPVDPVVREKTGSTRSATTTGRVDALELLGNIADKALAMGRFRDADRVLGTHLRNVLDDAKADRGVVPENLLLCSKYALKFAVASGDGAWFDYVIELFLVEKMPCPDELVIELQVALDKVDDVDRTLIERYVETMNGLDLSMEDTRRVQRIEELLFLVDSKRRR